MEHARPPPELNLEGNSVSRADAWKRWRKQFHLFLKASGVHKEEGGVQASLLINLIGTEGFDVYETFTFSNDAEKDDVTVLLKKFDEYFGVKPNVTLARYNFYTRNQEAGESIDQYVTALKLLSKICEFKTLEDEFIRDRIVCGIKNTTVRDRLLRTEELTLDKAIRMCQVDEVSADSGRVLLESRGASAGPARVEAVGVRRGGALRAERGRGGATRGARGGRHPAAGPRRDRPSSSTAASDTCPRCGGRCVRGADCPAISVQCYVCQNYDHFARMCKVNKSVKKLYDIGVRDEENKYEPDEDDDCESFYISALFDISQNSSVSQEWFEVLRGERDTENFKLDTGADINVLSYKRFTQLGYSTDSIMLMRNANCNDEQQHKNLIEKQLKSKMYYDQHCKRQPELSVGDDVIMLEHNNERMRGTVVGKASTPRSYIIKNKLGIYRRNRRHLIKNMPDDVDKVHNDRRGTIVVISDESSGEEYEMSRCEEDSEYEPSTLLSLSPRISPPTTRSRSRQNS